MQEEIKNILTCLEMDMLDNKQIEILLDYITNLQEENEYFNYCDEEKGKTITNLRYKIERLEEENKQLKELCDKYEEEHKTTFEKWKKDIELIDTILSFGIFTNMCPLELYFDEEEKENESKAQDTFFKDEYCENCKDDYKKCWLKYFKELNKLKGDNK